MEKTHKNDIIESLLEHHKISEKELVDYANNQHDEIMQIESIFDLKNQDDFNICITIPVFFNLEQAKDIIDFFKSEKKDCPFIENAKPNIEKYRLMLAAAFAFNPSFFAMAWNWCGLIKNELAKEKRQTNKPEPSAEDNVIYITWYTKTSGNFIKKRAIEPIDIEYNAASPDSGLHTFDKREIKDYGLMEFRYDKEDPCLQLLFKRDPKLEEPKGAYTIIVELLNKKDNMNYQIELPSDSLYEGWLISAIKQDVDCTAGIKVLKIKNYE